MEDTEAVLNSAQSVAFCPTQSLLWVFTNSGSNYCTIDSLATQPTTPTPSVTDNLPMSFFQFDSPLLGTTTKYVLNSTGCCY